MSNPPDFSDIVLAYGLILAACVAAYFVIKIARQVRDRQRQAARSGRTLPTGFRRVN